MQKQNYGSRVMLMNILISLQIRSVGSTADGLMVTEIDQDPAHDGFSLSILDGLPIHIAVDIFAGPVSINELQYTSASIPT